MASVARRSVQLLQIPRTCINVKRPLTSFRHNKSFTLFSKVCGCAVGAGILYYFAYNANKFNTVYAFRPRKRDDDLVRAVKLTSRERRFIKFASVEYDGQLYMTPQDFLESFVDQEPRPRVKRRVLTEKELEAIKDATPLLHKGSTRMFRDLRDKGIISYTEYLFLLSILTKPKSGFRIAFNMFDTDGNERVDKNEFLVLFDMLLMSPFSLCIRHLSNWLIKLVQLQKLLIGDVKGDRGELDPTTQQAYMSLVSGLATTVITKLMSQEYKRQQPKTIMEKIFSNAWKDKRGLELGDPSKEPAVTSDEFVDDEQGLQRRHLVDTTLTIHFFGKKGNSELRYEGFWKFMENLQTEVLEMEFNEFSKGATTISEIDFAKILLRYTYLDTDAYDMYLDRLLDRVKEDSGITFHEFKVFCQFLNNLEDFMIAMRMYTLADHPISKDEFHRAVKICTGTSLSSHVIHTVFALFDEDGDGQLSYREFIAIMKDRLHRGFKIATKNEGWEAFKQCVKQEIKSPG